MSPRTSSKDVSTLTKRPARLPRLPPTASFETVELLRACVPAHRALGAFEQCCRQSPISDAASETFKWLNAAAALQLDGTLCSLRELLISPETHRPEGLARYVTQTKVAASRLPSEPVGSVLALELASGLSAKTTTVRRDKLSPAGKHIVKSPPVGAEHLQMLLENWQGFVRQDAGSLDPLLVAGAAHGQWIALQPFTHANTVTGQILTSLLLVEEGLISSPVLPLIHTFAKNSDNYWMHLDGAISEGKRDNWLRHFLQEIETSAIQATGMMMAWHEHLDMLFEKLPELLPKTPSAELVRLCGAPSFGISDLANAGISRRQTATAWMQRLVDAGLLKESRVGKEKRYINPAILKLILNQI